MAKQDPKSTWMKSISMFRQTRQYYNTYQDIYIRPRLIEYYKKTTVSALRFVKQLQKGLCSATFGLHKCTVARAAQSVESY